LPTEKWILTYVLLLKIIDELMTASKDYRLTNEVINLYKQTFEKFSLCYKTCKLKHMCLIRNFTTIIFVMSSCAFGGLTFSKWPQLSWSQWKYFFNPIVVKLHRNDTWEVHMFNKYLLNYEFQNIEYQVSNEFSLAEFGWETLLWEDYVNFNWLSKRS
jgi:hypothetical protein